MPSPWPTLGHACKIPQSSNSPESLMFSKNAVEDCITNHKHRLCGQSNRDRFVPYRLLFVGNSTGSYIDMKLCESPPNNVEYVALSHCWGRGPTFTTTSATLSERKSSIAYDCLPKLFQDAVVIVQELGIKYLWIDALCIIQDSEDDWETQSAKMSSIYENAYVTIAATSAVSNDSGMFSERRKATRLTYQANPRAKIYKICARKVPDHHPTLGEDRSPARPDGPLRSRAWALQEHVLCSRILHYTDAEILFECRLSYRCECKPSTNRMFPTTPRLLAELLITGKKQAYWKTWHRIVTQFSARDLTVPSDKLPAISGIAKKFRDPTRSAYIAGLWKDNLVEDLLWSSDRSLQPPHAARRLDAYRAPSFSWASVDTQVQFYEPDEADNTTVTSLIKLCEVFVTIAGKNTLGAVEDGWIHLQGPVIEATLNAPEEYTFAYNLLRSGCSSIEVAPDSLLVLNDLVTTAATASPPEKQKHNNKGSGSYFGWVKSKVGLAAPNTSNTPVTTSSKAPEGSQDVSSSTDSASNLLVTARNIKTVRRARPDESYQPFKAPVLCLGIARYENAWVSGIVLGLSARVMETEPGTTVRCYERLGTFAAGDEWFRGAEKRKLMLV